MELKNQNTEIITNTGILDFLNALESILLSAFVCAVIFAAVSAIIIFIVSLIFDRDGR